MNENAVIVLPGDDLARGKRAGSPFDEEFIPGPDGWNHAGSSRTNTCASYFAHEIGHETGPDDLRHRVLGRLSIRVTGSLSVENLPTGQRHSFENALKLEARLDVRFLYWLRPRLFLLRVAIAIRHHCNPD